MGYTISDSVNAISSRATHPWSSSHFPPPAIMFIQSLKRPRDEDLGYESKRFRPWQSIPEARPEVTADLEQSLRYRASVATPMDSSDEERDLKKQGAPVLDSSRPHTAKSVHGQRPPMLHLGADVNTANDLHPVLASGDNLSPWLQPGSVQPSPIPHQLVNQFLTINGVPTTTPTHGYFPVETLPVTATGQQDLHMTREMAGTSMIPPPAIPLPSPIRDNTDAVMDTSESTGLADEDAEMEMGDSSPAVSTDHHTPTCTGVPRRRSPLVMGYRADCNKCRCKVPGHYSHIRA
ncbi:hypothetical protein F1880_005702 [Penicillium rolfsii]|nr:hypothetical protein F1880_005702 [Penicillium rolfsii]